MLPLRHCTTTAARKATIAFFILPFTLLLPVFLSAQTYSPVAVTGFNQDYVAEGGPSSLATTSSAMDGGSSNRVMYTNAFRTFAAIGGGGLPDNGTFVVGTTTFQMASYTGNNSLSVLRGQTGELTLTTPAKFNRIRVLCLATEGVSLVNASLVFTDGSTQSYLTNFAVNDWFNATANLVVQGIGRCSRVAAAPYSADGYPANPRMYYLEIGLNCIDKSKQVEKIRFSNVTTAGTNAPYPNAVFFAVSGFSNTQTITPDITASDCSGTTGSIALTTTGGTPPFTYSWSTTPVQTGDLATGLAPGSYTATITDGAGCSTTETYTVPLNNNATLSASASNPVLCEGQSVQLSISAAGSNLTSFTWTPGNVTGPVLNVTPASTTTYTVVGTNNFGCTATATVEVTVNPLPTAPVVPPVQICNGGNAILQIQNPVAGATYNWYTTATGGTPVFTGTPFTVNAVSANTTYYAEITSSAGCTSSGRTPVLVSLLAPLPSPAVVVDNVTFTSITFKWDAVPGATGYEVTTNGVNFQPPSSGPTGTTHTITGLGPAQTVSLQVRALMSPACQISLLSAAVSATTFASSEVFVPNVFTPNNDGKNDKLMVYSNAIVDMRMVIYNQWGEKIFETASISQGWDGRYKGVMQPTGVYVYVLKAKLQDGSNITKKGSISIIR